MTTGDLYILLIVGTLVVLSIYSIYHDKKTGKGHCGCGECKKCSGGCCETAPIVPISEEKKD